MLLYLFLAKTETRDSHSVPNQLGYGNKYENETGNKDEKEGIKYGPERARREGDRWR